MMFPEQIQPMLDRIVDGFHGILADNLVGIYLHGSLAMGGFNPHASDIDFLVVVHEPMDLTSKKAVAALALELAPLAPPKGLEFSIVLIEHTQHFIYPTPYEFHYSLYWHDAFVNSTVDWMSPKTDPDLAAHFTITRARGRCLYGEPIDAVFADVPEEHYWASILADAEDILDNVTGNPVYSILNLCRVIAYKQDKLITSKVEGGTWALTHLDPQFHVLIQQALDGYQSDEPSAIHWNEDHIRRFGAYTRGLLSS